MTAPSQSARGRTKSPAQSAPRVVVIGAGGHAAEVAGYLAHLEDLCLVEFLGCIVDQKPLEPSDQVNVLGNFYDLAALFQADGGLVCITATGDNVQRRMLAARVEALAARPKPWWTLHHPHAFVGPGVEIGEGTCVAPGCIITTRARIGRHSILNLKTSVSHDAAIGDYVNLNPGVVIAGNARIGDGCYIGAGATVIDKVSIGEGTVVGAGAVVVEDLPPNATAVGVPARVIKYHTASWEPLAVARQA